MNLLPFDFRPHLVFIIILPIIWTIQFINETKIKILVQPKVKCWTYANMYVIKCIVCVIMSFSITMSWFESSKHMKIIIFYFIAYKLSQPLHQLGIHFVCPLYAIHKYDNGHVHNFVSRLKKLWTYDVLNIDVKSSSL